MEISKALDYVRKNDRGVLATKARLLQGRCIGSGEAQYQS